MAKILLLALAAAVLTCSGCVSRSLVIHSNPEGAVVYVNDRKVGVTPLKYDFVHYGYFGIRLEKDGYAPFYVEEPVAAPMYEKAGVDFFAEAQPAKIKDVREFHYNLEPIGQSDNVNDVLGRAKAAGQRVAEVSKKRQERVVKESDFNPLPLNEKAQAQEEKRKKAEEAAAAKGDQGGTTSSAKGKTDGK